MEFKLLTGKCVRWIKIRNYRGMGLFFGGVAFICIGKSSNWLDRSLLAIAGFYLGLTIEDYLKRMAVKSNIRSPSKPEGWSVKIEGRILISITGGLRETLMESGFYGTNNQIELSAKKTCAIKVWKYVTLPFIPAEGMIIGCPLQTESIGDITLFDKTWDFKVEGVKYILGDQNFILEGIAQGNASFMCFSIADIANLEREIELKGWKIDSKLSQNLDEIIEMQMKARA